jgi:5-formyltetrahydrofolate cyclo-ligase
MAAAALEDDAFVFHECRYVSSRKSTLDANISKYFARLCEQFTPTAVYYYAPTGPGTVTAQLVARLEETAGQAGIPVKRLTKTDLFTSVSVVPVRTRRELREQLSDLWPVLAGGQLPRQATLAEAAAGALVGDARQTLSPP